MTDFIFDELKDYTQEWEVINSRLFNEREVDAIETNYVRQGDHGKCVCLIMRATKVMKFIQLEPKTTAQVNDKLDLSKCTLLQLKYHGTDAAVLERLAKTSKDNTIIRIRVPEVSNEAVDYDNPFGL